MNEEYEIAKPLEEAERCIGLALARLGKLGPGGMRAWAGAWGEYQRLGQLLVKTQTLRKRLEKRQRFVKPNAELSGGGKRAQRTGAADPPTSV